MDEENLQTSFDFLGLSDEASMDEVEKSFLELRNLYSEESLATYSLLDDADRQEKLESLYKAYERIQQSHSQTPGVAEGPDNAEPPATEPARVCIDADPRLQPGLFLQQSREVLGLSLQDVAARTKVRSSLLQGIEEQNFDFLPAPVYLRGFLREFARMVNVPDANSVVDAFMTLYENENS